MACKIQGCEAARAKWPRVAIGKANVIVAENRNPRLIIDPSVSGVNGAALIPAWVRGYSPSFSR